MIAQLIQAVAQLNLAAGISNALDQKLDNALDAWLAENAEQRSDAVNKMLAFINAVEAQRAKKITNADADMLIRRANEIIRALQQ